MRCTRGSLIILDVHLFGAALSTCDFLDNVCVTRASNNVLELMKPGIPGLLKPLDPLHEDRIEGKLSNLEYVLTNVTLTGMKTCRVELLSVIEKEMTFTYKMVCPKFVLTGAYAANGVLGSKPIDHMAGYETTIDDYKITFKGRVEKVVDEKDKKMRVYIKEYEIDAETKGNVNVEIKVMRDEDQEQGDYIQTYFKENWESVGEELLNPAMHKFWSHYIESLNVYVKAVPIDDLLNFV